MSQIPRHRKQRSHRAKRAGPPIAAPEPLDRRTLADIQRIAAASLSRVEAQAALVMTGLSDPQGRAALEAALPWKLPCQPVTPDAVMRAIKRVFTVEDIDAARECRDVETMDDPAFVEACNIIEHFLTKGISS